MKVKEYIHNLIEVAEQEVQVAQEWENLIHHKVEVAKNEYDKNNYELEREKWTAVVKERESALLRYQAILSKMEGSE